MRRTTLKGVGIETSALGFGCSGLMGSGSGAERQALLGRALDQGVTHFDVARFYGLGQAEAELGRFLRANPGRATVATKFGLDPTPLVTAGASRVLNKLGARPLGRLVEGMGGDRTHRFGLDDARSALESSLRKLGVETIDLYLLHDCSPEDVRRPELLEFLHRARTEGKIRAFGLATDLPAILEIDRTQPDYARVVQFENSVLSPNLERLPHRESRAIVTHRALSGNLEDLRRRLAERPTVGKAWSGELGIDLTDPKVLADAMLAYAVAANPEGVVLFSTTKPQRIEANVRAVERPVLDPERAFRFAELVGGAA